MESTPIHPKGETIRDRTNRLSTILPHQGVIAEERIMGPPVAIPKDRRPNIMARDTVVEQENFVVFSQEKLNFHPDDLSGRFDGLARRETFVKQAGTDSWTPQKLTDEQRTGRRTWERSSVASREELLPTYSESRLSDVSNSCLAQLQEEEVEDVEGVENDCSFNLDSFALSPPREKPKLEGDAPEKLPDAIRQIELPRVVVDVPKEEPLNLSVKTDRQQSIYQPEVSDIRCAYGIRYQYRFIISHMSSKGSGR
jgi:hypothetical protein